MGENGDAFGEIGVAFCCENVLCRNGTVIARNEAISLDEQTSHH